MEILVGDTGFVGSNILKSHKFDYTYNRTNIETAYGTCPDLLVYSGIPAQKFLANKFPDKDLEIVKQGFENIKKINPKKLVLISTIDVYIDPVEVDEDSDIVTEGLNAYGYNRYLLETWVKEKFEDYLIVHLPALFGDNIKKNYIYDLINMIPSMISEKKYIDLNNKEGFLDNFYFNKGNGFYELKNISSDDKLALKKYFNKIGFSALNFTDSRSVFQFYNLEYLWNHIETALKNNIKVLNLATEPVSASEIYEYIKGEKFENEISTNVASYDFRTKYFSVFGGKNGYIFEKEIVLSELKSFVLKKELEV